MAGHSKWNNIKRKKEKTDSQRAKIFTKISRLIAVAIKEGGADPGANSKLRECIAKAKSNNIPGENIKRIITKFSSDCKNDYENVTYEGYGAGGVAFVVETLTDNRNRTAGNLRHYFDKFGGNLGTTGCVSFIFEQKGVIIIEKTSEIDEEKLMNDAIELGAVDFNTQNDFYVIITNSTNFNNICENLEKLGYKPDSAALEMLHNNHVKADDECLAKIQKLIDILEDDDDVQGVWHNCELNQD